MERRSWGVDASAPFSSSSFCGGCSATSTSSSRSGGAVGGAEGQAITQLRARVFRVSLPAGVRTFDRRSCRLGGARGIPREREGPALAQRPRAAAVAHLHPAFPALEEPAVLREIRDRLKRRVERKDEDHLGHRLSRELRGQRGEIRRYLWGIAAGGVAH